MASFTQAPIRAAATAEVGQPPRRSPVVWDGALACDRLIICAVIAYLAVIGAMLVAHQGFLEPDQFFVLALAGVAIAGREGGFLRDWTPPVLLLIGYDCLRGILPDLTGRAHILPMIRFDRWLFGGVPTIQLQKRFFLAAQIHWYDAAAVIFYFLHFFVPLLVALLFWFIDRPLFKRYMTGMVLVSYMAFLTYCVFPAMPPWMAAQKGFLPHVSKVMSVVLTAFRYPVSLPTVYRYLGVDMVAAVPSLHATFPLMAALFLREKFPRWGWMAFLYPATVWLAVVYMGEHYVFDILAGVVYTLLTYALTANRRWVHKLTLNA